MSDHGAVQTVLSHDARLAPRLLRLAPLGSSVLEPNLQSNSRTSALTGGLTKLPEIQVY